MPATCVRDADSEHVASVSNSRYFPGSAEGPNSDLSEMVATSLKSELQTHIRDLTLTLSQFVFPVEIYWRNQGDIFFSSFLHGMFCRQSLFLVVKHMTILKWMHLIMIEQAWYKAGYTLWEIKLSWHAAGASRAGGAPFLNRLYLLWVAGYLHSGSVPSSKELTTLLFANTGFTQVVLKGEEVGQAEL